MPKFSYKDGCLLCNQCGQLYAPAPPEGPGKFECPCGNADTLDAIHQIIESYNPPADRPAERKAGDSGKE